MATIVLRDISIDPAQIITATDQGYYITIDVRTALGDTTHVFTGVDAERVRAQLAVLHLPFRDNPDLVGAPLRYRPCIQPDEWEPNHLPNANQVVLVGHIGQTPEAIYDGWGRLHCYFLLRIPKGDDDVVGRFQQGHYEWFEIYTLGAIAEHAVALLPGTAIQVRGHLVGRAWIEPDGRPICSICVISQELTVLESQPSSDEVGQG